MPFRKISDLPAGTAQGGELIPATQSGVTRRLTVGQAFGNIPFIGGSGLVISNFSLAALGGRIVCPAGGASDVWFRLMTINLADWLAAKITALVYMDNTGLLPVWLHVHIARTTSTTAAIGLEPLYQGVSSSFISDLVLVETSALTFELWAKYFDVGTYPIYPAYHVFGATNGSISLQSGTFTRLSNPPSAIPSGTYLQWSSTSTRLHTGRIVSAGSGSNGTFIRFSDGTQIAQHTIPSSSFGAQSGAGTFTDPYQRSVTWTYPAAFSAAPVVQVSVESTASGILVARTTARSSTNANIRVEYAASNAAFTANLLAIGRWY